jgi:hypothetical protein
MILGISVEPLVDDDFLMCPGDTYAVLDYVALHIVVTGVFCALPPLMPTFVAMNLTPQRTQ